MWRASSRAASASKRRSSAIELARPPRASSRRRRQHALDHQRATVRAVGCRLAAGRMLAKRGERRREGRLQARRQPGPAIERREAAPRAGRQSSAATRPAGSPDSSAKAASAKPMLRDSSARRIKAGRELARPAQMRRRGARRPPRVGGRGQGERRSSRAPRGRCARALGRSQPQPVTKRDRLADKAAAIACRDRERQVGAARAAPRAGAGSAPCRSTIRARLTPVMSAPGLAASAASAPRRPISASAADDRDGQSGRSAMAVWTELVAERRASTRSASVSTGERASTSVGDVALVVGERDDRGGAAHRGESAKASASARRTSGDGSSSSAVSAVSASRRSSGESSEQR